MSTQLQPGYLVGERIAAVLGIEGPIARLVLDVPCDGIPTLHVQRYLTPDETAAVVGPAGRLHVRDVPPGHGVTIRSGFGTIERVPGTPPTTPTETACPH